VTRHDFTLLRCNERVSHRISVDDGFWRWFCEQRSGGGCDTVSPQARRSLEDGYGSRPITRPGDPRSA
jgi:hypothetical protein